jgi:beta-lysine 5,6-aminomutase alpha subunit
MPTPLHAKLNLDADTIASARELASRIADHVQPELERHTTVATERTVIRLLGVDGVTTKGVPWPNRVVDTLGRERLALGAARYIGGVMAERSCPPQEAAEVIAAGAAVEPGRAGWEEAIDRHARRAVDRIADNRRVRDQLIAETAPDEKPLLYSIVATGNIYEDVKQAQAAARQGAQVIAVIRSTAQSLLDYVPFGPTVEGFGGTYATQENFRIMRAALDEVGRELGRYVRLVNYCSGLCMPEIAAMGAFERLDMMLNDALYGIIFRDINMVRTLVDQNFSRMINAAAGIVINTGEDNYLTTADAFEQAHTVLASQFVNEQLALRSGLPEEQMGLGHAFEIDPEIEDSFLWEVAQAQLVRQIFPLHPIKYMPPTKHMTGDIFRSQVQDALFMVASVLTGQSIHLTGVLTEAIHTPLLQDRYLSLDLARTIRTGMRHLAEEVQFVPGGRMEARARKVLDDAVELLQSIEQRGLFRALEEGVFAGIGRPREGGKGRSGVIEKAPGYVNPFPPLLAKVVRTP